MLTILLLATVGAAPLTPPSACSLVPFATTRQPAVTYFVGTARLDTIHTGVGDVQPSDSRGHWGSGRSRPTYGQLVRVGPLGGADSTAIEDAFTRLGSRDVIVVPWDYGPDCRPVHWGRSFRWADTEAPGFYRLRLRPKSEWVDNRPVLDAFAADLEPYPHGVYFQRGYRGSAAARSDSSLTPDEYLALYRALPTRDDLRARPDAVRTALESWERAHVSVAGKYPANAILGSVRRELGP